MTDDSYAENLEMRQAHALRIAQSVIKKFEPLRQLSHRDETGATILGYLRRVDKKGISISEADFLLMNDLRDELRALMPMTLYMVDLSEARIAVLLHLSFVLGFDTLKKMRGLWDAIKARDFEGAAEVMLLSDWPTKVGHSDAERRRAVELVRMMRTGQVRSSKGMP